MIRDFEARPSPIDDFRRLLFWIAVSLILHAIWLYALQGQLPIAATNVPNAAVLYVSPDSPSSTMTIPPPALLDHQPPSATAAEIEALFDELYSPSTGS